MDVHSAAPCIHQRVDWQSKIQKPYNTIQLLRVDEQGQAYSKSCGLYYYDSHVILIKYNYFNEKGYNVAYNSHTNL